MRKHLSCLASQTIRFLCAFLGAVIFVFFPAQTRAQERLVLGYTNLQSSKIPVPLAQEVGLFARAGLDLTLTRVSPGPTGVPKLLAGEIDLFLGNGDPVVKAILKDGAGLAIIASLGEDDFRLVARSSIRTPADLRGKRVGVSSPGSSADRIARAALTRLGFDPGSDLRMIDTGLNESRARLELLVKGEIDATIVSAENIVALGERRDAVTEIAELEQLGIYVSGSDLSVTRKLMASRRESLKRFLSVLIEAIARAKADPELAKKIYRKYAGTTDEKALEWRAREFIPKRIPAVPYPNRKAIEIYLAEAGEKDLAKIEAVADFSLLRDVVSGR